MEVTKEFLLKKLSPMEDKNFTTQLREVLVNTDLCPHRRKFRGGEYIVLYPTKLWRELYDTEPNSHELMNLTRSLQGLFWERSALEGNLIFVKEFGEYEQFGY